jgi:hypothetical protein
VGFVLRLLVADDRPRSSDWTYAEAWTYPLGDGNLEVATSAGGGQTLEKRVCFDRPASRGDEHIRWKTLADYVQAGHGSIGGMKTMLYTEADQIVHARSLMKVR